MQSQVIKRQAKTERRDKTYGSLEAFSEFLDKFTPPAGAFDPRGAWKLSYSIWLFAGDAASVGYLELERRPVAGGATLNAATRVAHFNGYQQQDAAMECAADRLSSVRRLELQSVSGTTDGQPVASAKTSVRIQVRGDTVEFARGARKRTVRAAAPVVTTWGLMDALQRLSPDQPKPLEFTLLDDGDLLKPAQRLTYIGKMPVQATGGAELPLHCWEQTGYGVLPTHYWLDSQGRLLFAVAGQRAYLYDAGARDHVAGRKRRRQA